MDHPLPYLKHRALLRLRLQPKTLVLPNMSVQPMKIASYVSPSLVPLQPDKEGAISSSFFGLAIDGSDSSSEKIL
jgi:hypothetical protein